MIQLAETDEQILRTFPVMRQLRPHLDEAEYVGRIRRMMDQGYRLLVLEEDGEVRAVAGFRPLDMLYSGRSIYVDDLVTAESARSRGHGEALIEWLTDHCRQEGYEVLQLDSGTHRDRAHRFYFRVGMHITSFHFARRIDPR